MNKFTSHKENPVLHESPFSDIYFVKKTLLFRVIAKNAHLIVIDERNLQSIKRNFKW